MRSAVTIETLIYCLIYRLLTIVQNVLIQNRKLFISKPLDEEKENYHSPNFQ